MLGSAPFDSLAVVATERRERLLAEATAARPGRPSSVRRALGGTLRGAANRLDPPARAPVRRIEGDELVKAPISPIPGVRSGGGGI